MLVTVFVNTEALCFGTASRTIPTAKHMKPNVNTAADKFPICISFAATIPYRQS
jgi:hypothetical protein